MNIVVCSGKGGTGKTTVATSLALSLAAQHETWYIDCDVEAPNGHIFLQPEITQEAQAVIRIPAIEPDLCTACGICVQVCQFKALALIAKKVMVFPQLCHGCGSCTWNCPEGAIKEVQNPIGVLNYGVAREGIRFVQGVLTVSEPMPTPIIRQLQKWQKPSMDAVVVRDSPPGASCSVVETLRGADFALMVTEPTPFGLHDLNQILGILEEMHIAGGVIINRDGIGNDAVDRYLEENHVPVMLRIPYAKALAEGISGGKTLIDILPTYRQTLQQLFTVIQDRLNEGKS